MCSADWDDDEDEQGPATEERAERLAALATRFRERLGEPEWRRLRGLLRVSRVATVGWGLALAAAMLLCFRLALGGIFVLLLRLVSRSWRLPSGDFGRLLLYLAAAVGIGAVFMVIDWIAETSLRRSLERHGEQGEDREELRQALWADYDIRRIRRGLAKQAREAADEARLAQEMSKARSRWQLESSGAYLVWWLCAAFWLTWLIFRWPLPDRPFESIGIITVSGLLFRLILLGVLRAPRQGPSDRLSTMRFYWWWGKGWLPALVALLPGVAYWVVVRFVAGG